MRRILAVPVLAVALLLAGCSEESEPIAGEWVADGPQPPGYDDFGNHATIQVDDGKATLGIPPMRLCGGAAVTELDDSEGSTKKYRLAFPAPCMSVSVPTNLDVVVDGDTLRATLTGLQGDRTFRFRRAD
ncbi:hypothetical protein AAHZ94_13805 [Streptomyces sp. HSW2009]|uniref:hypothetical protein n=1 Tax=Streptomyces sp. HSW2009 TaxID=3142890 RepID=UPI0032EB41D1